MKKTALSLIIMAGICFMANAQQKTEPVKAISAKDQQKIEPVRLIPSKAPNSNPDVKGAALEVVTAEPAPVAPVNPNAPEITFESEVIDYGTIDFNANGVREFKFTNSGKEPLIISNAKGSCGCTVPTWPKEPIMPGEKGSISVNYATNKAGRFTKTVTISSNAKTSTARLTIQGTVKPQAVEAGQETMPVKKVIEGATPIENNN